MTKSADQSVLTPYLALQWCPEAVVAGLRPLPAEHAVKKVKRESQIPTEHEGEITSSPLENSSSRADVGRPNDLTLVICRFAASISARKVFTRAR